MTGLDVFFRYSKKPLPYDAEVEYLQSTGTQWIDTEIYHNYANAVRFKLRMPMVSSQWGCPYADYTKEQIRVTRIIRWNYSDTNVILYHGSIAGQEGTGVYNVVGVDRILEGYTSNVRYYVNGKSVQPNPSGVTGVSARTIKLFYSNSSGPAQASGSRFYYFKIDNQCDLIPVRFTNENNISEGAMYDKVTKQLFRNQGTSSFIIGPDK